jgi:prepilin-type N-terminal cleavage/methylation domain-containing protein
MKRFCTRKNKGFALIELLVVIAVISILASIAIPNYASSLKKANAVSCLSVRRNIETEEIARLSLNQKPSYDEALTAQVADLWTIFFELASKAMPWHINQSWASVPVDATLPSINTKYRCPSSGTYLWLISDPQTDGYPKIGCSVHLGALVVNKEVTPNFSIPSGEDVSANSDFESLSKPPRAKGWSIVSNSKIEGWQSNTGGVEVWSSGMLGVKAPSGEYFIELDTYGKGRGKKGQTDNLSQQVETEAGRVYLVQLKARARKAGTSDFEILWDGQSASKISPKQGTWSDYSVKVVGTGAPITLSIAEFANQNNGLGALLDSIQVIATSETR